MLSEHLVPRTPGWHRCGNTHTHPHTCTDAHANRLFEPLSPAGSHPALSHHKAILGPLPSLAPKYSVTSWVT